MTLNKNNYFARYYNWIYYDYPNDLCSFFWGSVLSILLVPLIATGTFIARSTEEYSSYFERCLLAFVLYGYLTLSCYLGNSLFAITGYEFIYWWSILLGGLLIGNVFILGIAYLTYLWSKKPVKIYHQPSKFENFIDDVKDWIGAIRGKYCTKITWK